MATKLLLSLALAFLAESFTEYLLGAVIRRWAAVNEIVAELEPLKYAAMLVGLGLAFAYQLDIIADAFDVTAVWAPTGVILTGLALGRGANWLHDLWRRYLKPDGNAVNVIEVYDDMCEM